MGYDIYGNSGNYFRNNMSTWPPLWKYICSICSDILTKEDMKNGFINEAHFIDKNKSLVIAKRLKKSLTTGEANKMSDIFDTYKHPIESKLEKMEIEGGRLHFSPRVNWEENIKHFIHFTENSDGFQIW